MLIRKMLTRIIVAIVFIPAFLYILFLKNSILFFIVASAGLFIALYEFYNMFEAKGIRPLYLLGMSGGLIILVSAYFKRIDIASGILVFLIIFLAVKQVILNRDILPDNSVLSLIVTFFGVFYICWLGMHIILLREMNNGNGIMLVFLLFFIVWISDSAAYFIGSNFGRNKLAFAISPAKTVEGFIAAILFGTLFTVLSKLVFPELIKLSFLHCLIIGFVLSLISQLGDLSESMFKRYAKIKDSMNLIPGHGGILDKIDGLLFAAPVLYYYIVLFL